MRGGRNLIDLAGQTLAGARVLRRSANDNRGHVRWDCLLACGHQATVLGSRLREEERIGNVLRCKACQVRRSGPQRPHQLVRIVRVNGEVRKRCTGPCGLTLPLDAFQRDSQGPLGLRRDCRWCRRECRAERILRKTRGSS